MEWHRAPHRGFAAGGHSALPSNVVHNVHVLPTCRILAIASLLYLVREHRLSPGVRAQHPALADKSKQDNLWYQRLPCYIRTLLAKGSKLAAALGAGCLSGTLECRPCSEFATSL
jgi:hypothetical protein